jgi:hypothetical protein
MWDFVCEKKWYKKRFMTNAKTVIAQPLRKGRILYHIDQKYHSLAHNKKKEKKNHPNVHLIVYR